MPSRNDRYLREADDWSRRLADIGDSDAVRSSWESAILHPSNGPVDAERANQNPCLAAAKLACCGTYASLDGYVEAVAGIRRHSIAASRTITMVTTNSPTTIIHSTDPSC